jgi:vacuolar-type H+-ATPase subunit H
MVMTMKLSEVLDALLKTEDEALEVRAAAEREAKAIVQKARDTFARDQESRLNAAREEARAQVESARQSAEMEALHIADLARKSQDRMKTNFDKNVPPLIAKMAEDLAAGYTARRQP